GSRRRPTSSFSREAYRPDGSGAPRASLELMYGAKPLAVGISARRRRVVLALDTQRLSARADPIALLVESRGDVQPGAAPINRLDEICGCADRFRVAPESFEQVHQAPIARRHPSDELFVRQATLAIADALDKNLALRACCVTHVGQNVRR